MELNVIKKEALKLPAKLRADLARQLLNSLDNLTDSEIDDLWVEEALKRNEEIEKGEVKLNSHESIMEEVRTMLK
ncbi:MAG: addiction module protein [Desulfobacteraceae bacterium]|nr:addiction module protein [Desulfobacteraceae bacterium]